MRPYPTTHLEYWLENGYEMWVTPETVQATFDSFEGSLGRRDVATTHEHYYRDLRLWSRSQLDSYLNLMYFDSDWLDEIML